MSGMVSLDAPVSIANFQANPIEDFQSAPLNSGGMPTAKHEYGATHGEGVAYTGSKEKQEIHDTGDAQVFAAGDEDGLFEPTEDELVSLRKVPAAMP